MHFHPLVQRFSPSSKRSRSCGVWDKWILHFRLFGVGRLCNLVFVGRTAIQQLSGRDPNSKKFGILPHRFTFME